MIGTSRNQPIWVSVYSRSHTLDLQAQPAATLFRDIERAKQLFNQKRDAFKSLSKLYADRVPEWNALDRSLRLTDSDKEVQCVYRQNVKKSKHFLLSVDGHAQIRLKSLHRLVCIRRSLLSLRQSSREPLKMPTLTKTPHLVSMKPLRLCPISEFKLRYWVVIR